MKILLVTEKCSQDENQRDGGARLIETLRRAFGNDLSIMQFGSKADPAATWYFDYPIKCSNRFEKRVANADFIVEKVKVEIHNFTHVIFVHISMQFGFFDQQFLDGIDIWTFPMFLVPSYIASGERVPEQYLEMERQTLKYAKNILTPSHLEKRQLVDFYGVSAEKIHMVPRGINTKILNPSIRALEGAPKFCSIGSIKPQKNILGLIQLFSKVRIKFPEATLKIIGPVQNAEYFAEVLAEIHLLQLSDCVLFTGYVPPQEMSSVIQDSHLHLSTSTCETFGRSIFETLALGLPNVARKTGNAAVEFLEHLPYACFVDDSDEALIAIEEMLCNLSTLSSMALEIGSLYDDEMLSRFLVAKIRKADLIAISDYDGTLFHKDDAEKTLRCFEAFRKFSVKVICSARPIHDILDQLQFHNLEVDWIVGSSGSIVTDGAGNLLKISPLRLEDMDRLEALVPETARIKFGDAILQISAPEAKVPTLPGLRKEIYQGTAFVSNWESSKLRAVHRLLWDINWDGQVRVFGDGPYDKELLTYFDGVLITKSPQNGFEGLLREMEEIPLDLRN